MQENAPYVIICYLEASGKELWDIKMIYGITKFHLQW